MKVSAYKKLLVESPLNAMIFDLTERFPRGPKAKLRRKDYEVDAYREPHCDDLIGGENGYDMFELYKLSKKTWYNHDMEKMTTEIEDCAMGRKQGSFNYETSAMDYTGKLFMFKNGPQITRRIRRLEQRLSQARAAVEKRSTKNLYQVTAGGLRTPVALFGDSEVHALQQFDLLLRTAFDAAMPSGLTSKGYYDEVATCRVHANFMGPSHGPHEIVESNEAFNESMVKHIADCKQKIQRMQDQILAANDLSDMVNMYTMNVCAQAFGDES